MEIQVILSVVLTLLSTQADKCMEDQQCSNCSRSSQHCSTDCFSGYFGIKCKLRCSNQCINSKCNLIRGGIDKCLDGCVPGFYGTRCNVPCTLPKNRCTKCPEGCDGTFCHLTSSCVAGCHDQYYGSNCKNCSSRCRQCNRITGRCDACHDPYHGLDCEYSCEHCSTTDCVQACAPGLYGRTCFLRCHKDCLSYPTTITNDTLTNNSSPSCISECQRYRGECINGCADHLSGPHCSSPIKCNPNCLGCNETGSCVEGCLSGYFGDDCKPCPRNCFNHTCYQNNGSCDKGCTQGQYGQSCQLSCIQCPGGACHPSTGICVAIQSAMNVATIGTTTALLVLVFGIIATGCIFYFKRVASKRDRQADESILTQRSRQLETGDNYTMHQYEDVDGYEEISQRQWQQQERAEEEDNNDPALPALDDYFPEPHDNEYDDGIPVLPVLAEFFPGAQDAEDNNGGDTLPESGSGSQPYTPLMRDVFVDDPKTVVTYISPTEDNTE